MEAASVARDPSEPSAGSTEAAGTELAVSPAAVPRPSTDDDPAASSGCLPGFLSTALGYGILIALAASVARSEGYTWSDAGMAFTVFALVALRYTDVTRRQTSSVTTSHADLARVQGFAVGVSIGASLLWLVARALGPGLP